MNKMRKTEIFVLCLISVLLLSACGQTNEEQNNLADVYDEYIGVKYSERDLNQDWKTLGSVNIKLTGDDIETNGKGITSKNSIITINQEGVYVFTGEYKGQIYIDAGEDAKVQVVLNGVTIKASNGPAIMCKNADKLFITTGEDSENSLEDGATYSLSDDEPFGTIFSKSDLTINGKGTLTVKGNKTNGIVSKDDLRITGGNIVINSKNNGIKGTDSVGIKAGVITIKSGGNGIKTAATKNEKGYISIDGGKVSITSQNDGINAASALQIVAGKVTIKAKDDGCHSDKLLAIYGGMVNITDSYEGLEGETLKINGGNLTIIASDDGINASGESDELLEINKGIINVSASGDGLDSNKDIIINGGTIYVNGPKNDGNSSIDCGNTNSKCQINGGKLIAIGTSRMAVNFNSNSTQASLMYNVSGQKGDQITLKNQECEKILDYTTQKKYSSIMLSSSKLTTGDTYKLVINDKSYSISLTKINTTYGEYGVGGNPNGGAPNDLPEGQKGKQKPM